MNFLFLCPGKAHCQGLELGKLVPSIWLESKGQIYGLSERLLLNWASLRSSDIICYSSWKPESVIRQSKFKANNFGSLHFVGLPKKFQIQTLCQWLKVHLGVSSCCEEQAGTTIWFASLHWPNFLSWATPASCLRYAGLPRGCWDSFCPFQTSEFLRMGGNKTV